MTAHLSLCGDNGFTINYASEFDLRDGLAKYAQLCGWDVETEYVVHGWGRPDLVLTCPPGLSIAAELKVDLSTASKCRKAVQQADAYRRAMPEITHVALVAGHVNREVMEPYAAAYPHIWVRTAQEFLDTMANLLVGLNERHRTAVVRYRELQEELELSRRVISDLSLAVQSPCAAPVVPSDEGVLVDLLEMLGI